MELSSYIIPKDKDKIDGVLWITLYNMLIARYQYEGLENTAMEIDSIERALMHSGMCAIFPNKEGKLIALPCVMQELNIYGRPKTVTAYAYNSINESTDFTTYKPNLVVGKDCVVIYNNTERVSNITLISPFIKRLGKIWTELGNNLKMSRIFAMIAGSSEMAKEFKAKYEDMLDKGATVVSVADLTQFTKNFEKFDFKVEYRQEQYHNDFDATWQLLITMLGINNVGNEKRERLLVDEVNANNELLTVIEDTTKMYRLKGLEDVKKLYGVNITLKERVVYNERQAEDETSTGNKQVGGDDRQ